MRCLILSFFLCVSGVFAGEPSEVALEFLVDAQSSKTTAEVTAGLAISSFCGPEKRQIINDRWEGRASWLKSTKYELSSLTAKIDGDIAAVIIAARTEESPEAAAVIALGLVHDGTDWKVAPLEGGFANTGLGFSPEVKGRTDFLEQWMSLEKTKAKIQLLTEERARFNQSMQGVVDPEKLKLEDSEAVLVEFMKAAHAGELKKLLVWQGILERDQLPERDWERDIAATRLGMITQDPQSAWRTLRSNKVMKVIVNGHGDTEEASYLVAFLSSFKVNPRREVLNAIRFELLLTENGWRVQLPVFYSFDNEDRDTHREAFREAFDWGDLRDAEGMGDVFELANDPIRLAQPKAMLEGIIEDLKAGTIVPFLQRHFREVEIFEDDDEEREGDDALPAKEVPVDGDLDERRMERYRSATNWWGDALGSLEAAKAGIQKIYQEGDLALGIIKLETGGTGWKPQLKEVWMEKSEDGWMVLPGESKPLAHSLTPALLKNQKKISRAYSADLAQLEEEYFAEVLKSFGRDDPTGVALDEAASLELAKEWQATASAGSIMDLVRKSAVRATPTDTKKFMRDLSYLRASAGVFQGEDGLTASKPFGRFRGVSLVIDQGPGNEPSFPLSIIVPTKDGHKILADIELPFAKNKGQRLMNEARIQTLTKELSEADLASIVALRQWHQTLTLPVWEKWKMDQAQKKK